MLEKTTNKTQAIRGARKRRVGIVKSDRMAKSIVVQVDRLVRHVRYGRMVIRSNRFKVHDESNDAKIGDQVEIIETRPLSKDKRWRLGRVLRRASSAPAVPDEILEQKKAVEPVVEEETKQSDSVRTPDSESAE